MNHYHCLTLTTAALLTLMSASAFAADITVSAAASLTNAFKDISANYEKQYPDAHIKLNTAGSGALLQQALKGAPVDVLAFADQKTMDMAQAKGLIDTTTRHSFAQNALVIAAPKNGNLHLSRLSDLAAPEFDRIAISNPNSVPVGRYSKMALEKAKLWNVLTSKIVNTQHVRQSLDYVTRGEVDAGFVYNTDAVLFKDRVKVLKLVPTETPVTYPIAVVKSSEQAVEAKRFVQYVLSSKGQAVLRRYGFK